MSTLPPAPGGPSRLSLHLLPSMVLAVFVTVVFSWNPFGPIPEKAYFDAVVRTKQAGTAQLRTYLDGSLNAKADVTRVPVAAGQSSQLRFAIPAGRLRSLVFTPLEEGAEIDLLRCWLTTESGEVLEVVSPVALHQSNPQRLGLSPNGVLHFPAGVTEGPVSVQYTPANPIELAVAPPAPAWQSILVFVGSLGAFTALSLSLGDRLAGARIWSRVVAWSLSHPRRALLCAALTSVSLCCFPVIFCGKSFISPDNGVSLLYEDGPGVPGAKGGRVDHSLGSDLGATMYWHLPVSMVQHRAIFQDGEFPLWDRYDWGGLTMFGQSISMIGDPLDWIPIVFGGASWAWDVKFVLAIILFAFGVGLIVWRTVDSLPVALLLTLSAPFLGFFAYRYCHAGIFALCYAPWVLWPWIEARRARTLRTVALCAGFVIFANWWELNTGTAKEASAQILFMNLTGGLMILFAPESWRWRFQRLGLFAWATVLFVLLSAPHWGLFLDALSKAFTVYTEAKAFQMNPSLFIGLFDDIFQRQLMPMEMLFNPAANFFVLLGVAWAVVRLRALGHERMFVAAAIPAMGAAALVFGVVSPEVVGMIPFFKNIYHLDNTFSCVLFILFFLIAGFGLRDCLARMRSAAWTGDWVLMALVIGVALACFFGFTEAAHRVGMSFLKEGESIPKSAFFSAYALAISAAVVILPWAWRSVMLRRPGAVVWAAVAVAAFATLHFRQGMFLETRFDFYVRNPKDRLDYRDLHSPALDAVHARLSEPGRVFGLDRIMVPGFSTALGFETISGPNALMNPAMIDLAEALGLPRIWGWRLMVKPEDWAQKRRALDFLNVRFVLAKPGTAPIEGTKLLQDADLAVLESETAWPRAFFTDAVGVYTDAPTLARFVEEGDGRPFAAVQPRQRAQISLPDKDLSTRVVQPATGYKLTCNSTTFEIDAPTPGVAVLAEADVPGDILVSVDGQPASAFRVNHAFRGVVIEKPGRHVIRFAYRPGVLDSTLGLCAVGVVCWLLSVWVWWRSKPAPTPVPAETNASEVPVS